MAEENKTLSLNDIMKENDTPDTEKKKIDKNTIITPDMIKNSESKKVTARDIAPEAFIPEKTLEEKAEDEMMGKIDTYLKAKADDLVKNVIEPFKEACIEKAIEAEEMEAAGIISDKNNVAEYMEAVEKEEAEEAKNKDIKIPTISEDLDDLLSIADNAKEELIEDMNVDSNSVSDVQKDFGLVEDNETNTEKEEIETMEENNVVEENPVVQEPVVEEKEEEVVEEKKEAVVPDPLQDMAKAPKTNKPDEAIAKIPTSEPAKTSITNDTTIPTTSNTLPEIDDDDFKDFLEDEDNEEVDDEERKEIFNQFREQVIQKLHLTPASEKRLTKFKISSKPISVSKVLRTASNVVNTATWVLPNSGRLITFSALSGEEIENLNPEDSNSLASRITFNTLYNHLIDANKPATMEEWIKTINWFDINDLYFGIYLATFKNSNFITYQCDNPACRHMYLEEKPYKDMITYVDDKAEKLYQDILKKGIDMTPDTIEEDVIQINDKYAIGFRAPSIYDIIFGASSLDKNFRDKYATIIGTIAYMSNIYYIHHSERSDEPILMKIDCKPVENDPAKTTKNKIIAFYNVLKSLSSDEYGIISSTIINISNENKVNARFHYPDSTCPKCKKVIKPSDEDISPLYLVFIRHRLARYASIMTE